jgi:hypothetical protein
MRFSLSRCMLLLSVCCVAAFVFAVIWRVSKELHYGIDDAYAQRGMVELLVRYMEANDGHWPASWNDLEPYFSESSNRVSGWTLDDYQKRIWIDFQADIEVMKESARTGESATYQVIGAYKSSSIMGDGPNQDIHNYLRGKLKQATPIVPSP